jgi:hyperosmotically inducible protein
VRADRAFGAFVAAAIIAAVSSCSSSRGIESIGGYVDDSAITSTVKARFAEDKTVDAAEIGVETAYGNVVLSGVARSSVERSTAESLAIKVRGVKSLQNNIVVKP